jgi:hypothetical protein
MRDMQSALQTLRAQIAECERVRDSATDYEKRQLFTRLVEHFKMLAAHVEKAMADATAGDTFLGRKTQEPFPIEEDL